MGFGRLLRILRAGSKQKKTLEKGKKEEVLVGGAMTFFVPTYSEIEIPQYTPTFLTEDIYSVPPLASEVCPLSSLIFSPRPCQNSN